MPDSKPDLYEVLHIHPSAPKEVVQAAYRQLALLYHPDKNPSPEATTLMAQVNAAYEVLNDPDKRAAYDRERAAQTRPAAPPPGPNPQAGRHRPWAGQSSGTRPGSGAGAGFITLGSTKEEVLRVEGIPVHTTVYPGIGEEVWHFDPNGSICFGLNTGLVRGWINPNSVLKIRLVPGYNITSDEFFGEGSHRDDVVRLQGTPESIEVSDGLGREMWGYAGGSSVELSFPFGLVRDWNNLDGTLKVQDYSNRQNNNSGDDGRACGYTIGCLVALIVVVVVIGFACF